MLKRVNWSLQVENRMFLGEIKFIDLKKNAKNVGNFLY